MANSHFHNKKVAINFFIDQTKKIPNNKLKINSSNLLFKSIFAKHLKPDTFIYLPHEARFFYAFDIEKTDDGVICYWEDSSAKRIREFSIIFTNTQKILIIEDFLLGITQKEIDEYSEYKEKLTP